MGKNAPQYTYTKWMGEIYVEHCLPIWKILGKMSQQKGTCGISANMYGNLFTDKSEW